MKYLLKLILVFLTVHYCHSQSWEAVNEGVKKSVFSVLKVKDYFLIGTFGNGIYKSTDDCKTWTAVNNGINNMMFYTLIENNGIIYAASWKGGVYKSIDDGNNWIQCNNGLNSLDASSLIAVNSELFVGTYSTGVYKSSDEGETWTAVNNGINIKKISYLYTNNSVIYAGTHTGFLYISKDKGESWTNSFNGLPYKNVQGITSLNNQIFIALIDELQTGKGGIYKSVDDGVNWLDANNLNTKVHMESITSDGNCIFAGCYNNCFYSNNEGTNWIEINNGLPIKTTVLRMAIYDNYLYAGLQNFGLYRIFIPSLDIYEQTLDNGIIIYENPANDCLSFSYKKTVNNTLINIFNSIGEKVKTIECQILETNNINISELKSGMYYLNIDTNFKKFIKL